MSSVIAQARVKRLVTLGLVDSTCTPTERINELKAKLDLGDREFRENETFFSSLGDVTRLKILKVIGDEELCSCEVMAALGLTQPTTSHHLGILERAGVLSSRRDGKWVFYRIATPRIKAWLTKTLDMTEDLA
ncbi:MAG: metalloregulator ArsR/SmtB family transcription factor [Candidatus Bathyarchaeia archaeon]|jgi:DNA-binding transcriptional ArsR family regulator